MKKNQISILALFALLFTVISCNKEISPTGPTSVSEDKAFINQTVTNTTNCIKNARDGNLSQTVIQ